MDPYPEPEPEAGPELEDEIFDLNLLKKKKKKKKTFDLDTVLGLVEPKKENNPVQASTDVEPALDEVLDLENFGKKKKKKKPKLTDDGTASVLSTPLNAVDTIELEPTDENGDLEVDFSKAKKKKKSKKKTLDELFIEEEKLEEIENDVGTGDLASWTGSDRDYTYDELLQRVYTIIIEKNPEMAAGRKPKFVMRPPQVLRVGSKKTSFANFMDVAKTLHRMPKHLLDFLLAELGTSGSMDGNQQLIIKGRFQEKQIENVLRRYIKEYVTCHTCRSPDTILQKDTRIFFLQCESCGSRCSVASIKSGFQAVTGKRAAIRAKTT